MFAALNVKMRRQALSMSGTAVTPAKRAATTKGLAFADTVLPDSLLAERRSGEL